MPDEPEVIRPLLEGFGRGDDLDAILVTGGTGSAPATRPSRRSRACSTKPLPGYGELFRMLSYAEIGPACMLSRAMGG